MGRRHAETGKVRLDEPAEGLRGPALQSPLTIPPGPVKAKGVSFDLFAPRDPGASSIC